ncbi:hypothetical protein QQ045_028420 [Rhodiola kirilowii]
METPTLDNLDVPIMDEYNREEMENLEMVAIENPYYENAVPRYKWDHPNFEDISSWETNQPANEYIGGTFGLPDLRESLGVGTEFDSKELAVHANDTIMATNVHMTPKYIAKELWDVMTEKLRLSSAEIQARIYKDYGLEIPPLKGWQAKQQTFTDLFGTWDGSFEYLPHLMKALVDHSPETVVKWDTNEIDGEYIQVNRVFWAFAECIHAFKHCRPILSIDGTHLYDRHGGIMATMKEPQWSPPNAYHRICVHHFQSNFNTKVKDSYLKKKLGKVAYAKKEYKPDVRSWLLNVDAKLWSLALDTDGMRWGSMTTSASESFNGVLKHGRDLPISALVMFTFKQLNKYFNNRHYRYYNTDLAFAPKVHERLEVLRARAQFHRVVHFNPSQGIYQVTTGIKHHMWKVCLPTRTCECGKWTTLHIPRSHAIAVCKFMGREYTDYVPREYTLEAYKMTWSYHFSPLPHSDFWEPYDGLPHRPNPHFKRTNVGRNPTRRRRTEMDQRDVGQSSTQGEASSSQPRQNSKVQIMPSNWS